MVRSHSVKQNRTHIRHRRRHGHVHRQHCLQPPVGVLDSAACWEQPVVMLWDSGEGCSGGRVMSQSCMQSSSGVTLQASPTCCCSTS